MPKNIPYKEPQSKLSPKISFFTTHISIPHDVWQAATICAAQDSQTFGRTVSTNEFIIRAMIDRVGRTYGERYAIRLYRQFFNGLAPLKYDLRQFPKLQLIPFRRVGTRDGYEDYDGDTSGTEIASEHDNEHDTDEQGFNPS